MVDESTDVKQFNCSFTECKWTFTTKYKLERHLRTHTGEKPYACEMCEAKFATQYNLTYHKKIHRTCKTKGCQAYFQCKDELQKHEEKCKIFFKCLKKRCSQTFMTEKELSCHLQNHDVPYACEIDNCSKRFRKPSLLQQHILMHTGELKYKCTFENCSKGFNTMQRLARHKQIHENKKSFTCDIEGCGKAFNQKDYLKLHQRTHETKSIICPIESCQRRLVCKETLKVHIRGHENNRAYKCAEPGCDRTYLTHSNLKSHEKTHKEGRRMKKRSESSARNTPKKIERTETICVNEFLNSQIYGTTESSTEVSQGDSLSNESIIAAKFGEILCNQYINTEETLGREETNSTFQQHLPSDSESQGLSELDIQFQEEFVSNIYTPSINNLGVFDSGHDYEQSDRLNNKNNSTIFLTQNIVELSNLDADTSIHSNDIEAFETSMELSTGHLVIDGCYMSAPSYMPDHVYSHRNTESKSTVNLEDIR